MTALASVKKTSREDWHPADIKAALNKAGWTFSALSHKYGVGRSTLNNALVRSYPLAEERIAEAIGVDPHVIWPSRWNPDGTPKPRGINALRVSARERARNSKAAAAGGSLEKAA